MCFLTHAAGATVIQVSECMCLITLSRGGFCKRPQPPSWKEVNQDCIAKNTYMRGTISICFRKFQPERFKVKIHAIEYRHRKGQTDKFYWLTVLQAHLQNRLLKAIFMHLRRNLSIFLKMAVYYPKKPTPLHYNEKYPRYTKDGKYKPGLVNIPGTVNIRLRQCSFQWAFPCSD